MRPPCRGKDDQGCASPFWQALCAARDVGAGVLANIFLIRYFTAAHGERPFETRLAMGDRPFETLLAYVKVLGGVAVNAARFV